MTTAHLSLDQLRCLIVEAMQPGRFFVQPPVELEWQALPSEAIPWEIFHGRLLDASQTRQRQSFAAWNLHWIDPLGRSAEPLLAVKLEEATGRVHVVRSILSHAWEAYDEGDQVIRSRTVQKWLRELVATLTGTRYTQEAAFREDLHRALFAAVVGVSRLPLTSVEAPLPAYSLGQLYYHGGAMPAGASEQVRHSWSEILDYFPDRTGDERAALKRLEFLLRATPVSNFLALARAWRTDLQDLPAFFLQLFDEVALSPWTDFVDKTLCFLRLLEDEARWSTAQHADFLSGLLCRLSRHLNAFDLVKFHHRGANYPDALLLEDVLRVLLDLIERQLSLFLDTSRPARLRRRGLRQALLLRQRYEGHAVPVIPTSPGENARVLPAPYPHLTEEQILDPAKRERKLYPETISLSLLGDQVWQQSLRDLDDPAELRELGTALFLDRPLGKFKRPGESDHTPLLSYVAYSASLAERQLELLDSHAVGRLSLKPLRARLRSSPPSVSMPLALHPETPRPGVPSLQDAFQVAADFVLLYTTRRANEEFLAAFDWQALEKYVPAAQFIAAARLLIAGNGSVAGTRPGILRFYDRTLQPWLEFQVEPTTGRLQLLQVWQAGTGQDVRAVNLWLTPRSSTTNRPF